MKSAECGLNPPAWMKSLALENPTSSGKKLKKATFYLQKGCFFY